MSSNAPLFVRQLCDPRVAIQWPEAVAFIMTLAEDVAARDEGSVPDLEYVALTMDGTVETLPSAPASDTPVRQIGRALQTLLGHTDAPDELHRIAAHAVEAPDTASLDDVVRAISFFERPDREEQLATLAQRAAEVRRQFAAEDELKHLEERERSKAALPPETTPGEEGPEPFLSWTVAVAPVALVLAIVAVGGMWWLGLDLGKVVGSQFRAIFGTSEIPPKPLPDEPVEEPQSQPPGTGRTAGVRGRDSSGTDTERPAGERAGVASPALPAVRTADPGPTDGRGGAGTRGLRIVITDLGGEPLDDGTGRLIFTGRDPSVRPATLLRSPLPSEPPAGLSPADIGVFDMVIDEIGNVERIKLISPSNRYQERMLVSAAKAWKFRPATRDGRPVRFRLQVRITW